MRKVWSLKGTGLRCLRENRWFKLTLGGVCALTEPVQFLSVLLGD
jgi:hypothetical protein